MKHVRGVILLEVLAAIVIFSAAGVGVLTLLGQVGQTLRATQIAERRLVDEERLLAAHTLLTRLDLDRRLGVRQVGAYFVRVDRPSPSLYEISIGEGTAVDFVTMVHRPLWSRDAQAR